MRICKDCKKISFSDLEKLILKNLKRKKEISQKELAEHCNVSLTAIHLAVRELETRTSLVKTKKVAAKRGKEKIVWLQS